MFYSNCHQDLELPPNFICRIFAARKEFKLITNKFLLDTHQLVFFVIIWVSLFSYLSFPYLVACRAGALGFIAVCFTSGVRSLPDKAIMIYILGT